MHAELLALLLPPVSYQPDQPRLAALLAADGAQLDQVMLLASRVLESMTPATCPVAMLPDWEQVYGLPDPCAQWMDQSITQRRQRVMAKELETGGLSRAYYIGIARQLGYTIQIEELQQHHCEMPCEAPVNDWPWDYVWRVVAPAVTATDASCEDGSETPIRYWGNSLLECVLRPLRPAHTLLQFAYR